MAADQFRPPASGAAVFTGALAAGLARAGNQVVVLTPAAGPRVDGPDCEVAGCAAGAPSLWRTTSDPPGLKVVRAPAFTLPGNHSHVSVDLPSARMVEDLVDAFRPDVVHVQDYLPLCRTVARAAALRRLPLVATNHFLPENLIPYMPVLRKAPAALAWVLWKPVMAVLEQAWVVTTPTATGARILKEQGLKRPVVPISCGVDVRRFADPPAVAGDGAGRGDALDGARESARVRRGFGLQPGVPLFLFVGRVDREKRLDVLLEAVALVPDLPLHVAIAGKGEHKERLARLAHDRGLDTRVTFVGYVPDGDLPGLLRAADVFVIPSGAELQSIATLEAMACGKPVVAADARALPELVEPGKNGYLFTAGSAEHLAEVVRLTLARRDTWSEMGAASREIAHRHDHVRTVEKYAELYSRVAG
jgi:1,2-diacylglycerol 3-alpha-glucosyltransferase